MGDSQLDLVDDAQNQFDDVFFQIFVVHTMAWPRDGTRADDGLIGNDGDCDGDELRQ
ncbi:hypothetical protein [Natrinema soli]|uniref:Uncharacterized protein n=1 Tax=Natrinema soli TaxID=1930624 RepID=A0ABD5SNQ4_9EURY|nr:hypothetical protein [Natrinema soli]